MSVKFISDLKSKAISFEAKHKVIPKAVSAVTAVSLMAVPVSAETPAGSSTVDYSSIADTLKSSMVEVVNNVLNIATAIVPLAAGVWGLTIMVGAAKKFFTKITG